MPLRWRAHRRRSRRLPRGHARDRLGRRRAPRRSLDEEELHAGARMRGARRRPRPIDVPTSSWARAGAIIALLALAEALDDAALVAGRRRDRRGADRLARSSRRTAGRGRSPTAATGISSAGSRMVRPASAGRCSSSSPPPATSGSAPARRAPSRTSARGSTQARARGRTCASAASGAERGRGSPPRPWARGATARAGIALTRLRAIDVLGPAPWARRRGAGARDDPPRTRRGAALRDRRPDALPRRSRRRRRAAVRGHARRAVGRGREARIRARPTWPSSATSATGAAGPAAWPRHDARPLPWAQRNRLVAAAARRPRDPLTAHAADPVDSDSATGVGSSDG